MMTMQMGNPFLIFKKEKGINMKILLLIGAINGFLAVALGAFGAHGLEERLSEKMLATWEKAVQYQMFHTLAIVASALLYMSTNVSMFDTAGRMIVVAIITFSGC